MSDVSNGPGWWKANDGRWYPPPAPGSQPPQQPSGTPATPPQLSATPPQIPQVTQPLRNCPRCGNPLSSATNFCGNCGAPINHVGVPAQTAAARTMPKAPSEKSQTVAVLLAVFFWYFTFLYTYEVDKKNFWIGLGASVFGLLIAHVAPILTLLIWAGAFIAPIVMVARRPSTFYTNFPNG